MRILNLTQHPATPEQIAQGVADLQGDDLAALKGLLTFEEIPAPAELPGRALAVATLALKGEKPAEAMIGGAPFFMRPLEQALVMVGIRPVYAFTRRVVEETTLPDGGVRKTAVFRHEGFVRPCGE